MRNLICIAIGAFFGAVARYGVTLAIPAPDSGFPLSIMMLNLAGCLFLGWFFTFAGRRIGFPAPIRLLIGTGFTGTFTTFSTFSLDTVRMLEAGHIASAALYIASSLAGGLLLTWIGAYAGRSGKVSEGRAS